MSRHGNSEGFPHPELGVLPLLPTMGVGSCAAPGWFIAMLRALKRGELGSTDAEELFVDATRTVVNDQLDAGLDILTDGELRRQRFVYEMYQHIRGLERKPARRRLGITGYDTTPSFVATSRLDAPKGFGLVEEFRTLQAMAQGQPTKITLPGPLTFLDAITPGDIGQDALVDDVVRLVTDELSDVAHAGARHLQIDEPMLARLPHGLTIDEAIAILNRILDSLDGYVAVHVCFGNNAGRPMADRRFSRLLDGINALHCDQLVLEFANREFAEIEILSSLREDVDVAAGVVDVKNFYVETPTDVARRITCCLEHLSPNRLTVTADCGFSALPRHIAKAKLCALGAGARLVRAELVP